MEYSFSASGWLFIYQLGVARTLQKQGLHKEAHCVRCTGSSGGSLVSACLAVDADIDLIKDFFLDCVADCKTNPTVNMFKMREYVKGAFQLASESYEKQNGHRNFHEHESVKKGRLGVSVTLLPSLKNAILTEFSNQEELESAILGSCTMSPLAGLPFRMNKPDDPNVNGKWVFDGGMANIQPHTRMEDSDEKVITVSPFYFWDSDIKPSRYVPIWWGLYPPSVEEMRDLFQLGVDDGLNWVRKNSHLFKARDSSKELSKLLTQNDIDYDKNSLSLDDSSEEEGMVDSDSESGLLETPSSIRHVQSSIYISGYNNPVMKRLSHRRRRVSNLQPEGFVNSALDKAVIFTQKNIVKSIAVSTIYAELAAMASFNAIKGVGVAMEKRRREKLSQSKSFFSIRRWVPRHLLGSATGSLDDAVDHVQTLMKPSEIWAKVDKKISCGNPLDAEKTQVNQSDSEKCELSERSFVFRSLLNYLV